MASLPATCRRSTTTCISVYFGSRHREVRTVIDERWYVVVTSIFEPTPAVQAYATIARGRLVVVGDKKSPSEWHCDGVDYLAPETQNSLGYALADALPWNHYARKMLGYLRAAER